METHATNSTRRPLFPPVNTGESPVQYFNFNGALAANFVGEPANRPDFSANSHLFASWPAAALMDFSLPIQFDFIVSRARPAKRERKLPLLVVIPHEPFGVASGISSERYLHPNDHISHILIMEMTVLEEADAFALWTRMHLAEKEVRCKFQLSASN